MPTVHADAMAKIIGHNSIVGEVCYKSKATRL